MTFIHTMDILVYPSFEEEKSFNKICFIFILLIFDSESDVLNALSTIFSKLYTIDPLVER